jgi:hypothetical protein
MSDHPILHVMCWGPSYVNQSRAEVATDEQVLAHPAVRSALDAMKAERDIAISAYQSIREGYIDTEREATLRAMVKLAEHERNASAVAMAQAVCRAERDTASSREAWEAVGVERKRADDAIYRAETAESRERHAERRWSEISLELTTEREALEKAEAALARRDRELVRARVALEHCAELIRAACPDSTVWTDEGGLADEVDAALSDETEEPCQE